MATGNHIIHRLVFHIEVPRRDMAKKVQDEVSRHFEDVLLKQLNQLLDSIDVADHILIDKLNIDLGTATLENMHNELPAILSKALLAAIDPLPTQDADARETETSVLKIREQQKAFKVFCHFLQTGGLPWYAGTDARWVKREDAWLEQISITIAGSSSDKKQLLQLIGHSAIALNRLFTQFSAAFVKKLTTVLWGGNVDELQHYIDVAVQETLKNNNIAPGQLQDSSVFFEKLILVIALLTGKRDSSFIPTLQKWIAALGNTSSYTAINPIQIAGDMVQLMEAVKASETELQSSDQIKTKDVSDKEVAKKNTPLKDEPAKQETPDEDDTDGVFVAQAGLVILHPFLEYFFKDFGLLQNNDFVDDPARQLAVHLLHYLATGNTNAFEYDLQFEKFLCKWPPALPLERMLTLPDGMVNEADNMLFTVIKYWKSLKNTSPAGLREAFLRRGGKLIEKENPARLIVEKKDMDILLATLPWGLGVIKLPWIAEPFYVEWA